MWNKEEKILINQAATVLTDMQKNYGKQVNLKSMLKGWEMILADKMTGQEVVNAVKKYMERKSDIPTPADILQMHQPNAKKVSWQEYQHAREQLKAEGYPRFSYYNGVVKEYEKDMVEEQEPFQITGDMKALLEIKKF